MKLLPMLLCGGLGLAVSLAVIPVILKLSQAWGLAHGMRDAHHTHRVPVPRLGGAAVMAAFLAVELVALVFYPVPAEQANDQLAIILGSVAIFALGFWDDLQPVGAKRKLLLQILVASLVYAMGIRVEILTIPFTDVVLEHRGVNYLITVLWLVSLTNLINLVDGVDGLAGGICLMLMGLLAYVGQATCNLHLLAAGLVGGLTGFLRYNFPPARIYLGDGGAYFLGFLIGIMTIVSSQKGTVVAAMMAPLFVLALPILDTTLAIVRRGVQGLPVFRPDRRHIHHRLLETGVPQRTIVLGVYAFTAVFLGLGFVAFWSKGMWIPNLLGLGLLVVLLLAGRLNFSREWFAVGRVLGNSLSMRQEVQYALSLTNWIVLSSPRAASLDDLWEDFVFAARKLGFSYARIQLEDGERVWERPGTGGTVVRREMLRSPFGTLELGAVQVEVSLPENLIPAIATVPGASLPVISDHVFEITGELLAEGWLKAVRRWSKLRQLPPRFGSSSGPAKALPFPVEQSVSDSGNQPV